MESEEEIFMENLASECGPEVLEVDPLSITPPKKDSVQKSRKIQRNTGKEYRTQKGKIKPAKIFQNKDCLCSKECIKLMTAEERKDIFEKFWNLGNLSKQNLHLYNTVDREPVKRQRLRNGKGAPRNFSFKYFLVTEKERLSVCKRFFLDTFAVSEGRLQRTLRSEKPGCDMRGRSKGSRRKMPENARLSIINHINSFPRYPGFQSNVKFLHPDLNIRKMYNLFLVKCMENDSKVIHEMRYRKVFKKFFNLKFQQPREDVCQDCYKLNVKFKTSKNDKEKSRLMKQHDAHLKEADLARKAFQQDQNLAIHNPEHYFVFSFALQKPLPYPRLAHPDAYYKNNLFLSNVGFRNLHDKEVTMYLWDETIASRGSEEMAACLLKYVGNLKSEKHVIAYSDIYTGIKRNITVALTWLRVIHSPENEVEIIDHKFLSSGHTSLPNGEDFNFLETAIKTRPLFVPQEHYDILRTHYKFIINEMKQEDFVSVEPLKDVIVRRLNNTDGKIVNWVGICWMRFLRCDPYKMFYKTSMDEDFKVLDFELPRGEPKNFSEIQLPLIYKRSIPIAKVKYDDLMDLLVYIPPEHHDYFKTLPHWETGCKQQRL